MALAREPGRLGALQVRLQEHRQAGPLFDTVGCVRSLEQAFEAIWAAHTAGRTPKALYIQKDSAAPVII